MDVDVENVLKLIFPDGVPECSNDHFVAQIKSNVLLTSSVACSAAWKLHYEWREDPDFIQYISKLGSLGIEQLNREPDRLAEDKSTMLTLTQDLAFANYKTFIRTAECSRSIFTNLNNAEGSLQSILDCVPQLGQRCEAFLRASADINAHRRLNSLTLTRNAQILEVLELPQLMDTCIRSGNYEEALELAAYVRRLRKKHGHIPLIASVGAEVESAWLAMLQQLLSALRTDLPLPKCLQLVGYLRRMELFDEDELRLKFLQCRDSWLQCLLAGVPKDDAVQHLNRVVELWRVHLFSIVTQYRAVFGDSEQDLAVTQDSSQGTVFYTWLMEKLLQLVGTVEEDLSRGPVSCLDSVLRQCMYLGLSLSRVGADCRGLLAPIFAKTVQNSLEVALLRASRQFEQDLESFTLPKNTSSMASNFAANQESNEEHPPEALLEFRPLAVYCNAVLSAFNDLRLCAPVSIAAVASTYLQNSLSAVARALLTFYRQEQQALSLPEKEAFTRLCACLCDKLLPYLQRCLHAIFPPAIVAAHIGINTHRFQKEGITYLDRAVILQPIGHLLPIRAELSSVPTKQLSASTVATRPDLENATPTVEISTSNDNK